MGKVIYTNQKNLWTKRQKKNIFKIDIDKHFFLRNTNQKKF